MKVLFNKNKLGQNRSFLTSNDTVIGGKEF